ncbi:hypothetical protein L249_4586 [Ophiocordyceps polyrhachis-furcata BCC 54312]|uniref:glucose-6-phosphate 1-epimerase n=1 Tax=Ophiocordyceps polyrhachis-furcata BCC 54312 TaxID=1330021 RepID=A0A367LC25_9HYPO|nr:hypothetical protein L249_4586 [Ophiocordyceps polyrhachis-furcata BCC 54312]
MASSDGYLLGLRGKGLNWAIGAVAGCDFLLFGYDQGVMGGILTLPVFLDQFPDINDKDPTIAHDHALQSRRSTYQGIAVASYNLGCFVGAVITVFVGNPLGRRRVIFFGTALMVLGAALQASASSLTHFIIGRVITGLGNGANTSTVPMWQSETCAAHKRGKFVMIEGALITGGIMISYWVDLGLSFVPGSAAWRFPLAFQVVFCIFILALVFSLPESPRWLVLKGRDDEARRTIAAVADVDEQDKYVENELLAIKTTVEEMSKGTYADLFARDRNRTLHRTLIAYVNQMFQQVSGINLITYYAAKIYSDLGMSPFLSRLLAALNGTEYFIASWPAVFLVERVGRRKLMLFGAAGQAATMAILAGVNSRPNDKACQVAGIVFLFVFNTFFAVGWLGMTWLYPAEITPLRTRAPANALSTSSNWIFNFLVVMITPIAFQNIQYKTYIVFAVINAFMVPSVYFFFPETAYRSLEEMDIIFQKVSGWRGAFTVVEQARVEPRRHGKNGELLLQVDQEVEGNLPAAMDKHNGNKTMFTALSPLVEEMGPDEIGPNKPSALASTPGLPPQAHFSIADDGSRVTARLHTGESVDVLLYGATVISWKDATGSEKLWLSQGSKLDGSRAVRGGIPVVFPLFGPPVASHMATCKLSQHGFARSTRWEFLGKSTSEGDPSSSVKLDFGLSPDNLDDATRALWPYKFGLLYSVTLERESLNTTLVVTNQGEEPFEFQTLIHTYFKVDDISSVHVTGLEDSFYLDKTDGGKEKKHASDPVTFSAEIDGVFTPAKGPNHPVVISEAGKQRFRIVRDNLEQIVVWNPWTEKAEGMTDFMPKSGYKNMVCVEAGSVRGWQKLDKGDAFEGAQTIWLS